MNEPLSGSDAATRAIAILLSTGTWIACAILTLGLALGLCAPWLQQRGVTLPSLLDAHHLLWAGILMFVLLPVARVIATLILLARAKDRVYVALAAFVLLVIGAGVLWELRLA